MIFIFNGPPGSGKDECCQILSKIGLEHLSFKHQLFKETFKYFNVSEEWFMAGYNNREIKEKYEPSLGMSRREAMIHVSENEIKPKYGNDYFGKKSAENILENKDYCFSDGGFIEEIIPIINKVGVDNVVIVQLTREGCDFSSDSRKYIDGNLTEEFVLNHKTTILKEHILPKEFPIRTYRIHNNGKKEDLEKILDIIYKKERYVKKQNKNI